ncbi:MAG: TIGR02147 family protein [Bacteriovoracaceae bacterium]|jgi:uncharacterized protein (TIGR02147 family)|nr:TIGR02147 family protein [Bacteriovoracaceae bacterium]
MENELFREKLRTELITRTKRNPRFSIRSFARQLEIEPSSLSQIINGKRPLTNKMCLRLSQKLSLSPEEIEKLMDSEKSGKESFHTFKSLDQDQFQVIADWYHYAILELTHLKHFQSSYKWISQVLGINQNEVKDAVRRLERLDYLEITEQGNWIDRLGDANNEGNTYTKAAFRLLQKQVLEKAISALEEISYEQRVQTSMTLPVSKKKMKQAKAKVLAFIDELGDFFRDDSPKDEIYHMSFSLYPISKTQENKELR